MPERATLPQELHHLADALSSLLRYPAWTSKDWMQAVQVEWKAVSDLWTKGRVEEYPAATFMPKHKPDACAYPGCGVERNSHVGRDHGFQEVAQEDERLKHEVASKLTWGETPEPRIIVEHPMPSVGDMAGEPATPLNAITLTPQFNPEQWKLLVRFMYGVLQQVAYTRHQDPAFPTGPLLADLKAILEPQQKVYCDFSNWSPHYAHSVAVVMSKAILVERDTGLELQYREIYEAAKKRVGESE